MLSGKFGFFRARVAFDSDALAYLAAVEAADGQALEAAVRTAINSFVVGCKADGIWSAIKASCIMMGARTLTGAIVPLVGSAPTNVNFASGDYNRKTGLLGNGSTKRLNSNRAGNADPQNSHHLSVYVTAVNSLNINRTYIGDGGTQTGSSNFGTVANTSSYFVRSRSATNTAASGQNANTGFLGISRASSTTVTARESSSNQTLSLTSETPISTNTTVFGRDLTASSDARIAFYSIGTSINLALLESRLSVLYSAIGAAIP